MRELYRAQAKAIMKKRGYSKPNKCFRENHWRQLTNAYPANLYTGVKMGPYFHGKKHQQCRTDCEVHLFTYSARR